MISKFINKKLQYAVIGASTNTEKYGFKVFADLLTAGYKVYPINPKGGELLEKTVYKSINEVPEKINIVIFVVPPEVTEKELETVKKLDIRRVWMQPGSQSGQAIKFCEENGIDCMYDACIMVRRLI
jgi:uncharacterized protein